MLTEAILKWLSITSLCALVTVLAVQLTPRFVERAEAEGYEIAQSDPESPVSRPVTDDEALHRKFDERAEAHKLRRELRQLQHNTEPADPAPPTEEQQDASTAEVGDDAQRDAGAAQGDVRRRQAQPDELPLVEPRDNERFDVVHEDLPERHEALIIDDPDQAPVRRRFDYQREDLRTRHEALQNPDPFANQDQKYQEPTAEDAGDQYDDGAHPESNVKYYLVPVPQNDDE